MPWPTPAHTASVAAEFANTGRPQARLRMFERTQRIEFLDCGVGHWGVWTRSAVALLAEIKVLDERAPLDRTWLERANAVTDMNAALFDPAHNFRGCVPGILEVLRRQGLIPTNRCLNPQEVLSPGQAEELTSVCRENPALIDDDFVAAHKDQWLG